jgi:hypothetical protein
VGRNRLGVFINYNIFDIHTLSSKDKVAGSLPPRPKAFIVEAIIAFDMAILAGRFITGCPGTC